MIASSLGLLCRGSAACAVASVLLLVARAGAAEELGPILLSYSAPPGCPEVAEFQRRVESRSKQVHFVDEGSHERELSIRLTRQGDFVGGELRLIEQNGSLRQRSVRFTSCAEAVEGLALITAVSLDPQAQLQPSPPAPAGNPAATEPAPAASPRPVVRASPRPRAPGETPRQRLELALGVELNSALQLLPRAAFGGSLYFDVASGRRSWLAPLLRLTVSHLERRAIPEPGLDTNFALTLATLTVCPLKLEQASWVLRPCAFATAGVLRAWGSNTPDPQSGQSAFGAWGGSGLFGWRLTPSVELGLSLASGVTFLRNRYEFERELVWSTPALYVWGGLGFRFVIQ